MALRSRAPRRPSAGLAAALVLLTTTLSGCSLLPSAEPTLPSAQLKQELVGLPTGAKLYSRGLAAPGGVLTLDQFVNADFKVDERASEKVLLNQEDFRYAVETNWHAPDGSSADIFLLQFGDSSGSRDFMSSVAEGTSSHRQPTQSLSQLPGVGDGESWSAGNVDDVGDIEQIGWFTVGNIAADLHYYTPATANPAGLMALAVAQRARLAGKVTTPSPAPSSSSLSAAQSGLSSVPDTQQDRNRLLHDLVPSPSGAHPWGQSTSNGATGIVPLQQLLVRYTDGSDAQNHKFTVQQDDRGFQYAVRENWEATDGTQADVTLLQFATVTGAQSFTLDYQSRSVNDRNTPVVFPIPGDDTAKGYEHQKLTSDGYSWTEAFAVVGNVAVDVNFWRTAKPDRAAVIAIVQQQLKALKADPTVRPLWQNAPALPSPDS